MYAQLGEIVFEGLKGFDSFNDSRSTNYAEHALIEGKPRLQRVGTNLQEISLSVLLHASFCSPEVEYAAMDDARENGEVLPFVLGNGIYVGDFVIVSLQKEVIQTDFQGNIVSQSVSLSLKEYYFADRLQRKQLEAKQKAFATSSGGATPLRTVLPAPPSLGKVILLKVKSTKLEGATVNDLVAKAIQSPSQYASVSSRIEGSLSKITASMERVQEQIVDPFLQPLTTTMPAAVSTVLTAVQNLKSVLPIDDINDVSRLNSALQNSISGLSRAAADLTGAVIARKI